MQYTVKSRKVETHTAKPLTLSQTSPDFKCLRYKSFENTVGKGEIARNEQFLLFPQCFLPIEERSAIFIKFEIVICRLFQFWKSPKFVVWERVKRNKK